MFTESIVPDSWRADGQIWVSISSNTKIGVSPYSPINLDHSGQWWVIARLSETSISGESQSVSEILSAMKIMTRVYFP